jgi:hypothetical protein
MILHGRVVNLVVNANGEQNNAFTSVSGEIKIGRGESYICSSVTRPYCLKGKTVERFSLRVVTSGGFIDFLVGIFHENDTFPRLDELNLRCGIGLLSGDLLPAAPVAFLQSIVVDVIIKSFLGDNQFEKTIS